MAKAFMGFTIIPHIHSSSLQTTRLDMSSSSTRLLRQPSSSELFSGCKQIESGKKSKRGSFCRTNAFPDWPLMADLVEHIEGQRHLITHKSIVHLSDENIKNVSRRHRRTSKSRIVEGGAIEEIEQKVGSLRELEEAGKEELVK